MLKTHHFHIPVMGIGYTIDTPVKVAHFGISSVISLGDDGLIERMRAFYCKQLNIPYIEIDNNTEDYRAKRITAYLNLIDQIVQQNFDNLKKEPFTPESELTKYFEMLPDSSPLKKDYLEMLKETDASKKAALQEELKNNMEAGSIDVNIMTKLDKDNYTKKGEKMPIEYNDAHAAVRGFAHSTLNSGLVLSAGLSPRLYSYLSKFDCFFPDENGNIEKKIILKVSDYRSSLIQGKFLAKKGLWVTEYRVESGLNCGGHAFATNGFLMGPILDEFKNNRETLIKEVHTILNDSLKQQERPIAKQPLKLLVTAQGGVGTAKEHNFLLTKYNLDSIGWGTPFLLVPEAVNVDNDTFEKLSTATEDDLYLSNISPIGVPFNSLRGNTKDVEKEEKIAAGKPGSTCPSQFLKLYNTEFTDRPICVASRQYQKLKIEELNKKNLPEAQHQKEFEKITVKSCICAGLVMTPYIEHDMLKSTDGKGISVCPGPNMAYFSKKSTIAEMVSHIYGRINLLNDTYRPNLFVKELSMYVDYLKREINESIDAVNEKKQKYFEEFKDNLISGIEYYKEIIDDMKEESDIYKAKMVEELEKYYYKINDINLPVYQEAIVKG
ncbi:MAG: hypothetical protein OQJ96_06880 [Flavobacteriales bacterium]|nr:hypothetical protein [Flavobacteriales bacterium]MCW8913733.1 hypothetical protein [Flavobacteriales bacterium]MCW8937905.1 hypothetical protein [Flavobacteriales bacterium]MCW8940759.1 hypothetical protein [Flavobacteriales bacterium]MCW8967337.1 hypothetical protein [Flavobacteriales bacterium]